ncbi:hypothetical protein TNCV_4782661 [Trichonephila clavipes]|nr:hypothetical protein TNCV_4782661 [Trichonephila clavipes]
MALRRTLRRTLIETRNTTRGYSCRRGFKQESRPETQRWGRKTGEKRHESYKKNRGNVPGDLKSRVWIKRRGDKSHVKGAVENEKEGGTKRRGRCKGEGWKGEGFKGEGFRFKGDGFQFKGDRVSKETGFQDECQGKWCQRKGFSIQMGWFQRRQGSCQGKGFQMRGGFMMNVK